MVRPSQLQVLRSTTRRAVRALLPLLAWAYHAHAAAAATGDAARSPAVGGAMTAPVHEHGGPPSAGRQSPAWTTRPIIQSAGRPGGDRGFAALAVRNLAAAEIEAYSPARPASPWRTRIDGGVARIAPTDPTQGGMHWIEAREESPTAVTVASTLWTFSSKGPAPRALLDTPKSELEIVPQPAVNRYREGGSWDFVVRFMARPLPQAPVAWETQNGSRGELVADASGRITLTVPHDFDIAGQTETDQINRLQAQFVLTTERVEGGKTYQTNFNAIYSPDRIRGKSLAWGGGFMLLGVGLAVPLLRRKGKAHV
jgi:hypothetical protein